MISTLVSGSLIARPIRRTSQNNGRQFVTAQIRASADGDNFLVSVIAFDKKVCDVLLALDKGDDICAAGPSKPTTWTSRDGSPAFGLSVVAQELMTAYRLKQKRQAVNEARQSYVPAQSPLLDVGEDTTGPF